MMGKQEAGQKGIIPQVSGLITKQMPGSVCEIILHPSLILLSLFVLTWLEYGNSL